MTKDTNRYLVLNFYYMDVQGNRRVPNHEILLKLVHGKDVFKISTKSYPIKGQPKALTGGHQNF